MNSGNLPTTEEKKVPTGNESLPSPAPLKEETTDISPSKSHRSGHDVQYYVFDDDNGDDDDNNNNNGGDVNNSVRKSEGNVSEEPLHHQRFGVDDIERPLARHGCDAVGNLGRLGELTEGVYESLENTVAKEEEEMSAGEESSIGEDEQWENKIASMALFDTTLMSCFYMSSSTNCEESGDGSSGSSNLTETMVKVVSLVSKPDKLLSGAARKSCKMAAETMSCLLEHMQKMQHMLTEAGLTMDSQLKLQSEQDVEGGNSYNTKADKNGVDPKEIVCRGVHSIYMDSTCRLIGVIDVDVCSVTLSDVIAFNSSPFSQKEIVALLKSIIQKVGALHDAGFVHGCLHSGNVLCCSDDGRTTLTGACGIMSNPLFPTDASFISPRLASALQTFVQLVWNHSDKLHEETFPWASDPLFHRAVLERYGCTEETEMSPQMCDDIYAIGILTVTCLLGVPPFHSATLKEVVETLSIYSSGSNDHNGATLLGNVLDSDYAVNRFELAGYSKEFIAAAKDFVNMCLRAGCSPANGSLSVNNDLLMHRFFAFFSDSSDSTNNDSGASLISDQLDESLRMDHTMHSLLYPIFMVMESIKNDCGTTPSLPRLLRNSIFATRWDALLHYNAYTQHDEAVCGNSTVSVQWPYLASRQVFHTDEDNIHKRSKEGISSQSVEIAVNSFLYRSLPQSCMPSLSMDTPDSNSVTALTSLVESRGMRIDVEAHTLVVSGKTNDRVVLYRDEVPAAYGSSVDTLILQDLENCVIEMLLGFRFVVLSNVRRCKLLLGPCYYIYCEHVSDCVPAAVATAHLLIQDANNVDFYCGGCTSPRCYGDVDMFTDITFAPYTVAYAGLTADFAAVSLPQEHSFTIMPQMDVSEAEGPVSRTFKLYNELRGGYDYPYSHALAAFGNRFIHEKDGVNDMFLFFSEVRGKTIRIADIHGNRKGTAGVSASSTPSTPHKSMMGMNTSDISTEENVPSFPVVFIMDTVGDCVIENCSHCTIFVVGSTETITIRNCSELRLFLMAREIYFEFCSHAEAHLFVTEYLFLDQCSHMNVFPLMLEATHVDEIITAIVDNCMDKNQEKPLKDALLRKDIYILNLLLRRDYHNAMTLESCVDVRIFSQTEQMILVDFLPTNEPPSKFFHETSSSSRPRKEYVVMPFLHKAWGREQVPLKRKYKLPTVRLHDMVNVSILRLPKSLNLYPAAEETAPLVDVILERLSFGVVHLTEAMRTLYIHRCTGPLDIVVCAATRVIMENCEQVTLQIACGSFIAINCQACHTALHVNTPPIYENCKFMQSSTLNITSNDFESYLRRAGVEVDINLFDNPLVRSLPTEEYVHNFEKLSENNTVDSIEKARFILNNPVTLVQPLSATCLGMEDASFIDILEDRVNHEIEKRPHYDKNMIEALSFLLNRQNAQMSAVIAALKRAVTEEDEKDICNSKSSSPKRLTLAKGQVQERHFDPLVECSVGKGTTAEKVYVDNIKDNESSPIPRPQSESPPQQHNSIHNSDTGIDTTLSRQGSHSPKSIPRENKLLNDDNAHSGDETVEYVYSAADDEEDPTTVRKWSETRTKRSADPQCYTEAKRLSCDASSPIDTYGDARMSGDEEEMALDLVTYGSFPREEESLVEEHLSATDAAAMNIPQEGDDSASRQTPPPILQTDERKNKEDMLITTTSPPHSQTVSLKDNTKDDEKNKKTTMSIAKPPHMLIGNEPSFKEFIIRVHPDEEAAVRQILSMVTASREAAQQTNGSSIKELQRRVTEALKRIGKTSA